MPSPSAIHTLLTDSKVAKLKNPSPSKDYFARDTRLQGFGLRVSPKGVKSYFVEATVGGKFIRKVVGRAPIQTVEEARNRALGTLQTIRLGGSANSISNASKPQFRDLCESFLADKSPLLRVGTISDYGRVLNGSYFADWGDRHLDTISGREVLDRYQTICSANGIGMANKAMRILSSLVNHGIATVPSIERLSNPVGVLRLTRSRKSLKPREGHIPIDSLSAWFGALDAYVAGAKLPEDLTRRTDVRLLLKLLLLTGLRSTEGRSLRWSDVDLDAGTLTIRAEIAKNRREAQLPLCATLVNELCHRRTPTQDFVFPNPTSGHIRNLRRPLKVIAKVSGLTITPHDLRRTFATYLDAVGAPYGVIKQLLNHAPSADVTERYIQRRDIEALRTYVERVYAIAIEKYPAV